MRAVARDEEFPCGCFLKVYVCPQHMDVAVEELTELTNQLQLNILDSMVSVSGSVEGELHG